MARAFLKVFFDFEDRTEKLSDAERGMLLVAMLHYARTGEEPELSGNEQFLWPVFKSEIDREIEKYEIKVANGSKGGRPPKETEGNRNKPNETEENRNGKAESESDFLHDQEQDQEQDHDQEQEERENDDDDDDIRARAREAAVRRSFLKDLGRKGTPEEVRQICWAAAVHGFNGEMAAYALQRAAQFNPRSVVKYVKEILSEWAAAGCRTVDDVGAFQFEQDNRTGRNTIFGTVRSWKEGRMVADS